jgi:Plasma-membrane choline transporter
VEFAFFIGLQNTTVRSPDGSLFSVCLHYAFLAGAIIFTIIALLSVFTYFGFKSRIPLASLLLQVIMDVSKHHKSVFIVAFIALLVQAALAV